MQFFWKVTLVEGQDRQGTYNLGLHSELKGAPTPNPIPYKQAKLGVTYDQLMDGLFGCVKDQFAERISALSQANPTVELYHDHHLGV